LISLSKAIGNFLNKDYNYKWYSFTLDVMHFFYWLSMQ
jgi:hypothetical protein